MHYYLDGYNCLFCTEGIHHNLSAQRTRFLERLRTCVSALKLNVTVVFDSTIQSESTRGHLNPLECIYTNRYETADQHLIHLIEHSRFPSRITLVTSDNALATTARHLGAQTIEVFPFLNWLQQRYTKVKHKELHVTKTAPKPPREAKKSLLPPIKLLPSPAKEDLRALFEERYRAACEEEEAAIKKQKKAKKAPHEQNIPLSVRRKKQREAPPLLPAESENTRWRRLFEENQKNNAEDPWNPKEPFL